MQLSNISLLALENYICHGAGGSNAQLSLSLCNTMDCSPPDSSLSMGFPSKNTGVGCHSLLQGITVITTNKYILFICGINNGNPVELFHILKDDAVKVL